MFTSSNAFDNPKPNFKIMKELMKAWIKETDTPKDIAATTKTWTQDLIDKKQNKTRQGKAITAMLAGICVAWKIIKIK